jgi:hypothetical protein
MNNKRKETEFLIDESNKRKKTELIINKPNRLNKTNGLIKSVEIWLGNQPYDKYDQDWINIWTTISK